MTNVGNDRRKTVADLILPDFVPEGPLVIPEGFYRVSRKTSGFKRRGFPMTNVGNDIRKTVADVILPDFVPEVPSLCPKVPLSYPKVFIGYPEKTMDSKGVVPDDKRRE